MIPMNIDIKELLVSDGTVKIAKQYNLPPYIEALHLFNNIKAYEKIGVLKKDVSRLSQQILVVNGICANQNQALAALVNLQSHGVTEEQIISLNNFLESNGYKTSSYTGTEFAICRGSHFICYNAL